MKNKSLQRSVDDINVLSIVNDLVSEIENLEAENENYETDNDRLRYEIVQLEERAQELQKIIDDNEEYNQKVN